MKKSANSFRDGFQSMKGLAPRVMLGLVGAVVVLWIFWETVLTPLGWPAIPRVGHYLKESAGEIQTFQAIMMTGFRAVCGMALGFSLAIIFGMLTGRTRVGWLLFFFLLMALQKIPAIAMVHVFVKSKLGIGFLTTIVLAATVTFAFSWQILHHRARTLDEREVFALRVAGFKGWQLFLFGLLPHLGSALGGAARLAAAISLVMVVLGEWQGTWADHTIWQYGLGIEISRAYDSIESEARVLALCVWLGVLGLILDFLVQGALLAGRRLFGVDFKR